MGNGRSRYSRRGWMSDSSEDSYERENRRWMEDAYRDSDDSDASSRSPSPPPKRQRIRDKLVYNDDDDDYHGRSKGDECERLDYDENGLTLAVKYGHWEIDGFPFTDVVKKKNGIHRSKVFTVGSFSSFQFYFHMERLKTEEDTFYGLYFCQLSNRSDVTVTIKTYIRDTRADKYPLHKGQKFPRKPGCRFMGYLTKSYHMDEDFWMLRYMPENEVTFFFNLVVQYKSRVPELQSDYVEKRMEDNKVKDVVLVVKGEKFPASKKVLKDQSPVFAKLLAKNAKAKKLVIDNVEPEVMNQLLVFMYTGRVTKLFALKDEITAAANAYKLKDLKAICKKVL